MHFLVWGLVFLFIAACITFLLKRHPTDYNRRRRYSVVITGGSRGIGFGLAREFLKLGDSVVITSRSEEGLNAALEAFQKYREKDRVLGIKCDVSSFSDMKTLADSAQEQFGKIDIWINNAGANMKERKPLHECDNSAFLHVVTTNFFGVLNGCYTAIRSMMTQKRGHIFNMDGWGSDQRPSPRSAVYGFTKAGLPQFMATLKDELKDTSVRIHTISPGMVITDLLLGGVRRASNVDGEELARLKYINILAESTKTSCSWLVPRIRAVVSQDKKSGQYIKFLTPIGVLWRFATAYFKKNRFFDEQTGRELKKKAE